jgi:hypothetical protein
MSNQQNDELRERLMEEAEEIVELMIKDKGLSRELKEETITEIYNQLWEERNISIETEMDDDSE